MDLINEWTLTPLRFLDDLTQPMPSCAQLGDDRKNGIELTVGAEIAEQAHKHSLGRAVTLVLGTKVLKSVASDHK